MPNAKKKKSFLDHSGNKIVGSMEIRNQTEASADLFLFGDIVSESWQSEWYEDDKCPKDIQDFLDEIGEVETLNIHINSGGGSVFGGIAIYNLLKQKRCRKEVYIDGIAASIASVIACVGDVIHMPANGTFMVHKPSNGYFFTSMNADELRKDADVLDSCQKAILATYMTRTKDGVTEEQIEQMINEETWLIGSEAAEYFDFRLEDSVDAVACQSDFFAKYRKTPVDFAKQNQDAKENNIPEKKQRGMDLEQVVDKVLEKLDARKKEEREIEKQQLLNDLGNFGV